MSKGALSPVRKKTEWILRDVTVELPQSHASIRPGPSVPNVCASQPPQPYSECCPTDTSESCGRVTVECEHHTVAATAERTFRFLSQPRQVSPLAPQG